MSSIWLYGVLGVKNRKFAGPSAQGVLDPQLVPVHCLFFILPYPSPGSPGAQKKEVQTVAWTPLVPHISLFQGALKIGLVLGAFWSSMQGSILALLGAQVVPSSVQDWYAAHLLSKNAFSKKPTKTNGF